MEREGYKLAEIIQNRKALHRSLFSATRKLFGSGNSKSGQISEKYSETVDVQIRKLADLQFLMQQYQKASENYSYAKEKFSILLEFFRNYCTKTWFSAKCRMIKTGWKRLQLLKWLR